MAVACVPSFSHAFGVAHLQGRRSSSSPPASAQLSLDPPAPAPPLRTPHSGYHFDGKKHRFFEGWYFKVSIPEEKQSFAFMYSAEDPAFKGRLSQLEELKYGKRFPGIGAQVMGADDGYLCQYTQDTSFFWGKTDELALGNAFVTRPGLTPPSGPVTEQDFLYKVEQGFQVTPVWHQGFLCDDGGSPAVSTTKTVRWAYSTRPVYGWGDVNSRQRATAGWLAVLPVFEPHWQICMAYGLSTGWIEWGDRRFEFQNAPSYCEKNWGGAFPDKWFWVHCNVFEGSMGDISLTAGGGRRYLPITSNYEEVAMIGVHYGGKFFEFVPWKGLVEWEIRPWGLWYIRASNAQFEVEIEATTEDEGVTLKAPTNDAGLAPLCRDTFHGNLRLEIWERTPTGRRGKVILSARSDMAALEVGGGPWFDTWKQRSEMPATLKTLLNLPIDVESLFTLTPFLKPAGL